MDKFDFKPTNGAQHNLLTQELLPSAHNERQAIESLSLKTIQPSACISEACRLHAEPSLRLTYQTNLTLPNQADLEHFTASYLSGKPGFPSQLFLFRDQNFASYYSVLSEALAKHPDQFQEPLGHFAQFLSALTEEYVTARGITDGGFVAELGLLNVGSIPRWHLDSHDSTRTKLQLILVCAGPGGTLVTSGQEYDQQIFEQDRNLLEQMPHAIEKKRQRFIAEHGEQAWKAQKLSEMQSQQFIVDQIKQRFLKMVPEGAGIATDPQTVLIFKAGEVLHANAAVEGNRLVYSIIEV